MPHVGCVNATANDVFMGRDNVRDDERALGRGPRYSRTEGNGAPGIQECELDGAEILRRRIASPVQSRATRSDRQLCFNRN